MKPGDNVRVIGGPKEFRGCEGQIEEVRSDLHNSILVGGLHAPEDWREAFHPSELEVIDEDR